MSCIWLIWHPAIILKNLWIHGMYVFMYVCMHVYMYHILKEPTNDRHWRTTVVVQVMSFWRNQLMTDTEGPLWLYKWCHFEVTNRWGKWTQQCAVYWRCAVKFYLYQIHYFDKYNRMNTNWVPLVCDYDHCHGSAL